MKNPILRITLFASLFLFASMVPPAKVKYISKEGKFSITFPATYESKDMGTESYTSIQTTTQFEDQLFFITYNVHGTELTDHEGLAETSLNSFSEAMNGKITSNNTWTVKKNNGLKAKIEVEEYGLVADYGVVLVGQIQYQIAVVSATDKWNQERSDAFFKSFKLSK